MNMMSKLRIAIARMRRDESGSGTVEMLFMVPLLVWCFLATVSYFHAYRSEAIQTKAAMTLADMVSRETDYITPAYLNGMRGMLQFLTLSEQTPQFRLTVFRWNATDNKYEVRWSRERGGKPTLVTADLAAMTNQLPTLDHNEIAILVETWTAYEPKYEYNIGLTDFTFKSFMVVTPRFATQVCWNSDPTLDPTKAKC